MATMRDVDDRQPLMAEADRAVDVEPVVVMAAMGERIAHRLQNQLIDRSTVAVDQAHQSAHERCSGASR